MGWSVKSDYGIAFNFLPIFSCVVPVGGRETGIVAGVLSLPCIFSWSGRILAQVFLSCGSPRRRRRRNIYFYVFICLALVCHGVFGSWSFFGYSLLFFMDCFSTRLNHFGVFIYWSRANLSYFSSICPFCHFLSFLLRRNELFGFFFRLWVTPLDNFSASGPA